MQRALLIVICWLVPMTAASDVSDVAVKAQRAWRAGDGETVLKLAHPTLIGRIAELQLKRVETHEIHEKKCAEQIAAVYEGTDQ